MDEKLLKQIEQYLKDSGLNAIELKKRMDEVKASTSEFNRELINAQRHFASISNEFTDISDQLKNVVRDLSKTNTTSKDINSAFRSLSSHADKLKYDAQDISRLSKQDLVSAQKKIQINVDLLAQSKRDLDNKFKNLSTERIAAIATQTKNKDLAKQASQYLELQGILDENGQFLDKENNYLVKLQELVAKRLQEEEKINKQLGISGKIVDGIVGALGKLGISSTFFENLKEDMREVAKTGSKWDVLMTGVKGTVSGIGQALKDPVTQLTILLKIANFFFKAALNANAQAVELGKQLGYGTERADEFREKMVAIESSSNNLNVTTANLTQAFGELVKSTGFAYEFTADQLETQIKLTKQVGLQADEAAQVQRYAALSGKSSEETYRSFVRGLTTARNQLKVGIDFRSTLAEAVKVSGQLAANLGYNPERIAKAVVTMKALGTTLEDTKSQAESLLNFESSIENELKAELLTGQALNLERARALALQGDMAGVANELANQGMTAAKFSKMNVLAQNAYAQSLGTTSDKLSEQLRKREEAVKSGKSLQQISEEEAAQALERQSVQDKFNAAVEKLQSLFGNLMAGPLGSFLDLLSGALNIINYMATPLKIIGGIFLGIKATQLAINASKRISLGLDIASKGENMIAANMGLATIASKRTQTALEKESLLTRIAGNAQLLFSLIREQGISGIKAYALGLEEKSLARKIIMGTYDAAAVIAARTKALFEGFSLKNLLGQIARIPILLGLRSTEAAIATTTAAATVTAAEATTFGAATVWIVAGLAAVMGALGTYMAMKDGIIDPSKGPIMTGGFGSVQLDPNDKAMYGADGKIKVGTDLAGGGEGGGGGVSIDLSPVVSALVEVKAAIGQLINKEGIVMMDSVKVGTTQNMNGRYKTA
jgi:hypothetical protein